MQYIYFEQITVEFVGIIQDYVNPHGGDADGDGENIPTSVTNPPHWIIHPSPCAQLQPPRAGSVQCSLTGQQQAILTNLLKLSNISHLYTQELLWSSQQRPCHLLGLCLVSFLHMRGTTICVPGCRYFRNHHISTLSSSSVPSISYSFWQASSYSLCGTSAGHPSHYKYASRFSSQSFPPFVVHLQSLCSETFFPSNPSHSSLGRPSSRSSFTGSCWWQCCHRWCRAASGAGVGHQKVHHLLSHEDLLGQTLLIKSD